MNVTTPKYDLFGPRFKADAYTVYARMRAETPIYRRVNSAGTSATCFITRYDDAVTVLRDHKRFVKDARNTMTPAEQSALPAEPPLLALRGGDGQFAISTIATVTFYGHDQTGRAVSVSGKISIEFADWADKES